MRPVTQTSVLEQSGCRFSRRLFHEPASVDYIEVRLETES